MASISRNYTVDIARLFGSFGVIAMHVPGTTAAARVINVINWPLCVPFFYLASLTFFILSLGNGTIGQIFNKTWQRLLIPFLCWTLIYLGLFLAKGILGGAKNHDFVWWRVLFYGESTVHLYFLPTLLLFQALAMSYYYLFVDKKADSKVGLALLAGSLFYLLWGYTHNCFGVSSIGVIVGIVIFIFAGFQLAPHVLNVKRKPMFVIMGAVLVVFAIVCNYVGFRFRILDYPALFPLGGIGLLMISIGLPLAYLPKSIKYLCSLSYGIYLCHVIVLEAFEFLLERVLKIELEYTSLLKMFVVIIAFALSALIVHSIRQNKILKKLLLGE